MRKDFFKSSHILSLFVILIVVAIIIFLVLKYWKFLVLLGIIIFLVLFAYVYEKFRRGNRLWKIENFDFYEEKLLF